MIISFVKEVLDNWQPALFGVIVVRVREGNVSRPPGASGRVRDFYS